MFWGFPSHTSKHFSVTSAGCPTIQLNSDTFFSVIASDTTSYPNPPPLMPVISTNCHMYNSNGLANSQEVPMTPSFGSINLLEWFTELREIFYILIYQLILKVYNSGTTSRKRLRGQSMGKRLGTYMPSLGMILSMHFHMSTMQKLSKPCPVGFYGGLNKYLIENVIHRHD